MPNFCMAGSIRRRAACGDSHRVVASALRAGGDTHRWEFAVTRRPSHAGEGLRSADSESQAGNNWKCILFKVCASPLSIVSWSQVMTLSVLFERSATTPQPRNRSASRSALCARRDIVLGSVQWSLRLGDVYGTITGTTVIQGTCLRSVFQPVVPANESGTIQCEINAASSLADELRYAHCPGWFSRGR